ncbi:NXPE family member 3-like [Saccoglossus kowalevskii]|uniref:NXPE family member 3-like n=1 Tax=Saccoglossus kowalevskii TaxID=10224 RepID=A0ABM0M9E3_SACKO|nr:PREDICTED: NXPE family member 3-like [Saccoglossus kowalevskii]
MQEFLKTHIVQHQKKCDDCTRNTENIDYTKRDKQLFPYNNYNRFGMEWVGIVEELEWAHLHGTEDKKINDKLFDVETGTLGMTSVNKSRMFLHSDSRIVKMGEYVHVLIEAYDNNGRKRNKGGDLFLPTMVNMDLRKSTAGRIVDYGNGTYSVFFYAAWVGDAYVKIQLHYTREAISLLKNVILAKEKLLNFDGYYKDGNDSYISNCSLVNEESWSDKCEYSNTHSMGKTAVVCRKPASFRCDQLLILKLSVDSLKAAANNLTGGLAYMFDSQYHGSYITNAPIKLGIIDGTPHSPRLLPCGPDLPIPLSDGHWVNKVKFEPMVCRSQQWTEDEAQKCISDKEFIVSGDSTVRQIKDCLSKNFSFTGFHNHFTVPRVGSLDVTVASDDIFESDLIDNFTQSNCQNKIGVVVLNMCFHFGMWSTRAYVERIYPAKRAIQRLIQKCPNTKILIKLCNPRDNFTFEQRIHSNNWTFYNMNRIMRRIFGGMGVHFLDFWDLVVSSFTNNTIHMPWFVIYQEVHLMLSYICPHLVK